MSRDRRAPRLCRASGRACPTCAACARRHAGTRVTGGRSERGRQAPLHQRGRALQRWQLRRRARRVPRRDSASIRRQHSSTTSASRRRRSSSTTTPFTRSRQYLKADEHDARPSAAPRCEQIVREMRALLAPATLAIVPDGANVQLDGRTIGRAPIGEYLDPAGRHLLTSGRRLHVADQGAHGLGGHAGQRERHAGGHPQDRARARRAPRPTRHGSESTAKRSRRRSTSSCRSVGTRSR